MAELETPEEAGAMNAACGVWHDGLSRDDYEGDPRELTLSGFWAGWLAGRDYARNQEMLAQIEEQRQRIADDPEWGPDSAQEQLERGPR